jgi:hypothetical protein
VQESAASYYTLMAMRGCVSQCVRHKFEKPSSLQDLGAGKCRKVQENATLLRRGPKTPDRRQARADWVSARYSAVRCLAWPDPVAARAGARSWRCCCLSSEDWRDARKWQGFGWAVFAPRGVQSMRMDTQAPLLSTSCPCSTFIIGQQDISSHVSQHDALTTCTFVHSALICWSPAPTNAAVPSIVPKTRRACHGALRHRLSRQVVDTRKPPFALSST